MRAPLSAALKATNGTFVAASPTKVPFVEVQA
ncbi:hypothetical protein SAMN05443637_104244 [Pseudonocardia thermophila]|jgi:hypothetical protein|uniref:Uncharacterized protein n=1 Tax=Pseudonocardia thermophila TaxID=1848 RepID=A0A1M6R8V8_PSETH|nr:hypothetical protein SAMN05443637_104244 [Pseudonocardia thermophila]